MSTKQSKLLEQVGKSVEENISLLTVRIEELSIMWGRRAEKIAELKALQVVDNEEKVESINLRGKLRQIKNKQENKKKA